MALKRYIPTVHVLNNGDVALGGRRRWCWPFLKQTKYLLQLIAETLTFYLDIILFENVPAQIANGVFSHNAAASSTLLHVDPALRHTRYRSAGETCN